MRNLKLFSLALLLLPSTSMYSQLVQWNQGGDNHTMQRLSIGANVFSDKLSIESIGLWHIRLKENGTGGQAWRIGSTGSGWAAGAGKFIISNTDASTDASLTIDGQRNVGIGTTSPKGKLHVLGGGRDYYVDRYIDNNTEDGLGTNYILLHTVYTSTLIDDRFVMGKITAIRGTPGAINRKVTVEVNTSSAYNSNRGTLVSYNEAARLVLLTYNGQRYLALEIPNGPMLYGLSFTGYAYNESLILVYDQNVSNVADFTSLDNIYLQGGAVGIGTKSPDATLTVNGNIHAKEVKVDLSIPAPDYVFKKDYRLRPLTEVKNYIDQNSHLPEVPSAVEMETKGINLGDMNITLLKKVEELTLYLIEQNEQLREGNKVLAEQAKLLEEQRAMIIELQGRLH